MIDKAAQPDAQTQGEPMRHETNRKNQELDEQILDDILDLFHLDRKSVV